MLRRVGSPRALRLADISIPTVYHNISRNIEMFPGTAWDPTGLDLPRLSQGEGEGNFAGFTRSLELPNRAGLLQIAERYTRPVPMLFKKRSLREEFERAVQAIFPSVYSTALRLTRNQDDAQDLTQEAVVRAFQAYDRFDGQNFKAWMLRILTNVFINRYRKEKREPDVDSIENQPAAENVASEEANPSDELFDNLVGEQVEEALMSLPDEYRTAVLLCDVEGLSYEEIAEALRIPIGTVRSRLARGRAALRKKLREYAEQEGYLKGSYVDER